MEMSLQIPAATASQGAGIATDPGSAAGNQEGTSKPQQSPSAKGNEPDPQSPSTSTVPVVGSGGNAENTPQENSGDTVPVAPEGKPSGSSPQNAGPSSPPGEEDEGTSGSTPQDNGGNVGSSVPDGPIANGAETQASSIPNTPDSVSKGVSGLRLSLRLTPNEGVKHRCIFTRSFGRWRQTRHSDNRTWGPDHTLWPRLLRWLQFCTRGWHLFRSAILAVRRPPGNSYHDQSISTRIVRWWSRSRHHDARTWRPEYVFRAHDIRRLQRLRRRWHLLQQSL